MKHAFVLALTILFFAPWTFAEQPSIECPAGQMPVTSADGNDATTVCVEKGDGMDSTVPQSSDGEEAPGNYD